MLQVLGLLQFLLPWCLYSCWGTSDVVAGTNSDVKMGSEHQCESVTDFAT